MANFNMDTGINELMEKLNRMVNVDETAKKMVDKATPILQGKVKQGIRSAASRGYATGALAESIQSTKAKTNGYGVFAAVRPTGTDERGTRNGEKLAYLEFGTVHEAARPSLQRSVNEATESCLTAMQEVFNREVGE